MRKVIAAEKRQYRQYACSRKAWTYSSHSVDRNMIPTIKIRNLLMRAYPKAANVASENTVKYASAPISATGIPPILA